MHNINKLVDKYVSIIDEIASIANITSENIVCLIISIFIFSRLLSFIIDLYNFIPYEIIKHHKAQIMLPTKEGLVNLYEGDYITKDGDFYNIYTKEEFFNEYTI